VKPTDTRFFFRPLCREVVSTLRGLEAADWERPTLAPAWRVRDVAAHLLDTCLRRLSFHRDGLTPPPPAVPIRGERDFVAFINQLNASWIESSRRLSPRVLTDAHEWAAGQLCDFVEALPADAPARFPVSWAGQRESPGWLDIGREFTEIWHHGAQIREAVGVGPYSEPRWLRAVLEISLHALPHAYRDVDAPSGATLVLEIAGAGGGTWTLRRVEKRWEIVEGVTAPAAARVRIPDEAAWRLFFNALPEAEAARLVQVDGEQPLAAPLLRTRAVIV